MLTTNMLDHAPYATMLDDIAVVHVATDGRLTMSEFATLARRHARSTKIRSRSTGANRTSSAQMAARCDIPERILRRAARHRKR